MTEQDILRHAKGWLDKLAKGIDPLTGKPVPSDDVVRKERIDKLKTGSLLEYLDRHGFLEMRPLPNGRSTRQPTQIGQQLGIGLEERQGAEGPYTATVYNSKAQRFLLKHMDEKKFLLNSEIPFAIMTDNQINPGSDPCGDPRAAGRQ